MVVLKKYRNVGTSPIVASKRLRIEVGETTDFIVMDPEKEKFALQIGALEIVEARKEGKRRKGREGKERSGAGKKLSA